MFVFLTRTNGFAHSRTNSCAYAHGVHSQRHRDGCDAADKLLYIFEGGIGRDEQFSEKVLERGMMRVIQDYDSNEDALAVHVNAMVEAALVAEQNHGYPSKLTEPSLMVGNTLKNWANTLDIYDYLQVLVSLEVFLDNCSDIAKKLSPETP